MLTRIITGDYIETDFIYRISTVQYDNDCVYFNLWFKDGNVIRIEEKLPNRITLTDKDKVIKYIKNNHKNIESKVEVLRNSMYAILKFIEQ